MEDFSQLLADARETFAAYFNTLILAVIVLLVGYILAKIVQRIVKRIILVVDRDVNQRLAASAIKIDLRKNAKLVSSAFFWVIMAITVVISIEVLNLVFLKDLIGEVLAYLPNIVAATIIVFVGIISGRLLSDLLRSTLLKSGTVANRSFLIKGVRYFVVFVSVMIAADQLGIHVTFLTDLIYIVSAALLFGAALAFGLGAKDAVRNILSSYYVKKDHRLGTMVKIGENTGLIVKISDHAIHLETSDGTLIIPARTFNESKITIIKEADD